MLCVNCRYRKFSENDELVCELNGQKPEKVDFCENYSGEELAKEGVKVEAEENYNSISEKCFKSGKENSVEVKGWLWFFLWIVLGLGTLISLCMTYASLEGGVELWLVLPELVLMCLCAGKAISGFYKRSENAVAYVYLYIVTKVTDAIVATIFGENMDYRVIVWGIIWCWYMNGSKQVERLIPKVSRRIGSAKVVLALIIMYFGALLVYGFVGSELI